MPTLHALFIAINEYPDTRHHLSGCVNDMQQMQQYLEARCQRSGVAFRPRALVNKAASRQAIIDGFRHFESVSTGDYCVLYFAGHGSRSPAPEALRHLDADHAMESIVCWDSRLPGGYDLMDKELSYLIWKFSQKTDTPFVTIMDCCHAGSFREMETDTFRARQLNAAGNPMPIDEYLGIREYQKTDDGRLSPPHGRRVHLGAARDVEKAKEVSFAGVPRGIFTKSLIDVLNASNAKISYASLIGRVGLRIRNVVPEQSPQLEATIASDKNLAFLFGGMAAENPVYLVSFDKRQGWVLNAGAIHGISEGDGTSRTMLELPAEGRLIEVEKVLADCSKVNGMDACNKRHVFDAVVKHRAIPRLALAFAPGCDPAGERLLRNLMQHYIPDVLVSPNESDGLLIHVRDNHIYLTRSHDPVPLFQRVKGCDEAAIRLFLTQLNVVANWQQVLELHNPDSGIGDDEVALELLRVTDPGNESDNATVEPVDWRDTPVCFPYAQWGEQWLRPAFQLKIRNIGARPLWAGLLYLGSDFSINNQLLPKQALNPGSEIWATDIFEGYAYRTIPLQIDDHQQARGITAVDEYIKLLISTEELNTDLYYQEGLRPDTADPRGIDRRVHPTQRDWATKTVWIRIERFARP